MIRLPFVEPGDVAEAVDAGSATVAQGGVVLLPTESFYGLGADPKNETAVDRIFSMKDRPSELSLPVLDVFGTRDRAQTLRLAPARAAAAKRGGNARYLQLAMEGAGRSFYGVEVVLVKRVRGWLGKRLSE